VIAVPSEREQEMSRLRTVEGLTLEEIADRVGVGTERVRQLLRLHFGLEGTPPAASARRQAKTERRQADDLARAQARASELLSAWRTGEEIGQLVRAFGVSWRSVELTVATATDADRAARADARRNSRSQDRSSPNREGGTPE
jgi:transcriptional regulator with XRE-family HTH domain